MGNITEKYESNKTKDKCHQVQCIECNKNTQHKVVQSLDLSRSEVFDAGQSSIDWSSNYQIIQCQGCLNVTFRQSNWCSEDGYLEWEDGCVEILFPKRTKNTLPIKDFWNIPPNLSRIYRETIECFNNDALTLSATGLRALVEGLCAELKVENGPKEITKKGGTKEVKRSKNLEGKIAGLHEKGYLTKQNASLLHEHRYLGNEAVHQLAQPSMDELKLAIEIIEHIFDSVYEIPNKGKNLKHKRTNRSKKP